MFLSYLHWFTPVGSYLCVWLGQVNILKLKSLLIFWIEFRYGTAPVINQEHIVTGHLNFVIHKCLGSALYSVRITMAVRFQLRHKLAKLAKAISHAQTVKNGISRINK